ncbi:MAG: hypothetical protein Kow0090_11370 [Myxococcota bacterium]
MKKLIWLIILSVSGALILFFNCGGGENGGTKDAGGSDDNVAQTEDDDDNDDADVPADDDGDAGGTPSCDPTASPLLNSCVGDFLECFHPNGGCTKRPLTGGLKGYKVEFLNQYTITYKDDGSGNVRSPTDITTTCASFEETEEGKRKWQRTVVDAEGKQTILEATQEYQLAADGSYYSQKWTCPDGTTVEFGGKDAKDICLTTGVDCAEIE